MSRIEKLITRFYTIPRDFTWDEMVSVLEHYGYEQMKKGKTGGSRRKFVNVIEPGTFRIINLHKPHPGNIVKEYAIKQVIEHLKKDNNE